MVVIGFLGQVLDGGPRSAQRWQKWRPTISLCQHEEMKVDRLELLIDEKAQELANQILSDLKQVSPETQVKLHPIQLQDPWDFEEVYGVLHDFAAHYAFDLEHEDYFMHLTTGTHVEQICMFLLTEARYFPAKLLQTSPPRKNHDEPGNYSIIDLDLSKYDRIAERFQIEMEEATSFLKSGIATRNKVFNHLMDEIERVVLKTKAPILLMGPAGTGKSQLARKIYELKKSRHKISGPLIEVNCSTLKVDSAMSTLIGPKTGLLAAAHNGILVLDEIADLGLNEQAMILRAIEEKRFLPLGTKKEVSADFQLLATTNKDLIEEITKGHFRADLFARLSIWSFSLPSLIDRKEDLESNIAYELQKYLRENAVNITFNKEANKKYLEFCTSARARWPANFRDLSASISRMATLAEGGRIKLNEVDLEIERLRNLWSSSPEEKPTQILTTVFNKDEIENLDLFDQIQLAGIIEVCRKESSLSAAGRTLFSATRSKKKVTNDADRLKKYLDRFGLSWKKIKE